MKPKPSLPESYSRWWKTLSAKERAALTSSGLFKASDLVGDGPVDRKRVNDGHHDFSQADSDKPSSRYMSEVSKATVSPSALEDVITAEDNIIARLDERIANLDAAGVRLRATLSYLLDGLDKSTDPAMHLHSDIIRIVVGEGCPPSMAELARRHGFSRAAVSLRCRRLLGLLGLEPSRFMRPNDEVESMKKAYFNRVSCVGGDGRGVGTPTKESPTHQRLTRSQSRPRENLTKIGQKRGANTKFGKSSAQ